MASKPRALTGAWPCPSENPAGAACRPRSQAASLTGLIGPDEEKILKRSMLKLQQPASESKRQISGPVNGCGPAQTEGCPRALRLLELGADFPGALSAEPPSQAPPTCRTQLPGCRWAFHLLPTATPRGGRFLSGDSAPVPELAWLLLLPPLCLQLHGNSSWDLRLSTHFLHLTDKNVRKHRRWACCLSQ